nr:hypothetical protein [Phytohabitans rumicis]
MSRHRAALAGLLALYLAARVVICVRGKVFTSYDSVSYRGDGLVSLTGNAPRMWGVPLFYAIFPNDQARAIAQWTVGTVAWALLAWALWTWLRTLAARCVAVTGVLLLGLLPQVANWDFAILSESLSISLAVVTLALLLRWGRTRSVWFLAGATATAVWWTFTRPDIRVLTVFLIVALVVVGRRRRAALAAAGVLAAAVIWGTAIIPAVDRTYTGWSATPEVRHEEGLLLFRLRLHVLPDPEVKAIFQREFGMPSCAGMEEIAAGPSWETARFAVAYAQCPEIKAWGNGTRRTSGSGTRWRSRRSSRGRPGTWSGCRWRGGLRQDHAGRAGRGGEAGVSAALVGVAGAGGRAGAGGAGRATAARRAGLDRPGGRRRLGGEPAGGDLVRRGGVLALRHPGGDRPAPGGAPGRGGGAGQRPRGVCDRRPAPARSGVGALAVIGGALLASLLLA